MKRSFTFIHRLTRRMTECGRRERNGKSTAAGCLFNVPSFPPESWCQQECVTVVKGSFILCTRRQDQQWVLHQWSAAQAERRLPQFAWQQLCISTRWSPCSHVRRDTEVDKGKLSRLHRKRSMATEFTWSEPARLSCLGSDARKVPSGVTKAEEQTGTVHCTSGYMGNFTPRSYRKSCPAV